MIRAIQYFEWVVVEDGVVARDTNYELQYLENGEWKKVEVIRVERKEPN